MGNQPFSSVSPAAPVGATPEPVLQRRDDGVFFRASSTAAERQAAVGQTFLSGAYFSGLDYDLFLHLLYDASSGEADEPVRFADTVEPLALARRALYKSVKIVLGEADYYFEPVFLDAGAATQDANQGETLRFDEFVADMWQKGIRFGIDAVAVRAAIGNGKPGRCLVARRRDAVPGRDGAIVEVTEALHRSNAPREGANGKLDLHTFQNRFPQVSARTRLLKKMLPVPGIRGYELSGIPIEAPVPKDVELTSVAGTGTVIEHLDGTDFLVAAVQGFVNVDRRSRRISIGPRIVSREGVSVRTTGNLQLTGEYEEFGEVQENRVVEGGNITIHGDVFGRIVSRGGTIVLRHNLMGGTAINADGAIRVAGVAANAVLQTRAGEVAVQRAQSCIITGTRVRIGVAINCEIMADEVVIGSASGCAIAARSIVIESAGPHKHGEMMLFALVADTSRIDDEIADLAARGQSYARLTQRHRDAIDVITGRREVSAYLALAQRVRQREVVLTPEQLRAFQKIRLQVGPALQEVAQLSLAARQAQTQQALMQEGARAAQARKDALAGAASCRVRLLAGETVMRAMPYNPEHGAAYDLPARDVRTRLRAEAQTRAPVWSGSTGTLAWPPAARERQGGDPD
ncbi:flagellar assembly protein A [Pseudoduganella plicata]|uniref:Flagellar Assembly Protein A N-terminal region domain-containing protein n=1 Tax=Pseudoduganella plicata TaxID=321984 RepID=A0AA88C5A3_9BURK|nr:flagellar assembly protein A [Pseudoduganella plicata]GGY79058.1 hypothetical protein GCM10007388_10060 [Pseudoduganella plicata]